MMNIRHATEADLPALLDIHNDAIRTQAGIWLDREDTLDQRTAWFRERLGRNFPVIVGETAEGRVVGYGSYGTYRAREGYRLTVEHSVYILPEGRGAGMGRALMEALIRIGRERGMHAMVAVIDAENHNSVRLHEKLGFISAGVLPQLGVKFGTWRDQHQLVLLLDDRPTPPAA